MFFNALYFFQKVFTEVVEIKFQVCVEVPGRVENPDRLIQMVGGADNLVRVKL